MVQGSEVFVVPCEQWFTQMLGCSMIGQQVTHHCDELNGEDFLLVRLLMTWEGKRLRMTLAA